MIYQDGIIMTAQREDWAGGGWGNHRVNVIPLFHRHHRHNIVSSVIVTHHSMPSLLPHVSECFTHTTHISNSHHHGPSSYRMGSFFTSTIIATQPSLAFNILLYKCFISLILGYYILLPLLQHYCYFIIFLLCHYSLLLSRLPSLLG